MAQIFVRRRRFLAGLVALGAVSPAAMAQKVQCFVRTAPDDPIVKGFEVGLHPFADGTSERISIGLKPSQTLTASCLPKNSVSALISLTVTEYSTDKRYFRIDGRIEELNQAAYVLPRAPRIAAKFDDADSPNEVEAVMSGRGFQLEFEDEARFLGNSKGTLELKVYTQAIEDPNAPTIILRFRPERLNAAWQAAEAKLASIRQTYAQGACLPQRYEPPPREGCFLTTAAVETIGLADDCWELRTLRAFRDNWLVAQPDGATDIAQYYAQAPAIAQSLRADPKRLSRLYFTGILPSAIAARMGLNRLARSIYSHHMRRLAPLAPPLAA